MSSPNGVLLGPPGLGQFTVSFSYGKSGKLTCMWKLNSMHLHNQWVKEEIRNYFEMDENEDTTYQNLWDAAKASGAQNTYAC